MTAPAKEGRSILAGHHANFVPFPECAQLLQGQKHLLHHEQSTLSPRNDYRFGPRLVCKSRSAHPHTKTARALPFLEASSAFTARFGLHTRGVALRPFTPEASEISLPTSLLQLPPTVATLVGWESHPLKIRAFSRRTISRQLEAKTNSKTVNLRASMLVRNRESWIYRIGTIVPKSRQISPSIGRQYVPRPIATLAAVCKSSHAENDSAIPLVKVTGSFITWSAWERMHPCLHGLAWVHGHLTASFGAADRSTRKVGPCPLGPRLHLLGRSIARTRGRMETPSHTKPQ